MRFVIKLAESIQRPQRVNRTDGRLLVRDELLQRLCRLRLLSFDQQPLRRQPPERIVTAQCLHEIARQCAFERRDRRLLRLLPHDAIDASARVIAQRILMRPADTRLGVAVEPGYANTVLVAPATADVRSSSLVIAGRDDEETVGAAGLLWRIGRLITP